MANAAPLLSTLADPTRRSLVEMLRDGPLSVGEMVERTTVTQSAVSQHLHVLKAVRLVEERREGSRRYYSLNPAALGELRAYVDTLWNDALTAFSQEGTR
jgi:DNA-binding transcriptional ArsR family regulator